MTTIVTLQRHPYELHETTRKAPTPQEEISAREQTDDKCAQTNVFYELMTTNETALICFDLELIHFNYSGKYSVTDIAR